MLSNILGHRRDASLHRLLGAIAREYIAAQWVPKHAGAPHLACKSKPAPHAGRPSYASVRCARSSGMDHALHRTSEGFALGVRAYYAMRCGAVRCVAGSVRTWRPVPRWASARTLLLGTQSSCSSLSLLFGCRERERLSRDCMNACRLVCLLVCLLAGRVFEIHMHGRPCGVALIPYRARR